MLLKKIVISLGVILLIGGSFTPAYYFYTKYQKTKSLLTNPTEAAKEETRSVTNQLGKLMELPNEEPTVATILDYTKLKDQPFFAKAKNGDKVIIYTKAMKAILFRPDTNKVIDFAPINIGTSSAAPVQPVKVALYNGTETANLIQNFGKDLKTNVTNIEIVSLENAKKTDYEKTLVVDISGKKPELAKQLAGLIKGTVSLLPAGEVKPTKQTDLLVIVGKDYPQNPTPTLFPTLIPTLTPTLIPAPTTNP